MTEALDLLRQIGAELNTAVIGDILDEMGFRRQFLPPEIRALHPDVTMVGLAMPVLEQDTSGPADPFGKMFEAPPEGFDNMNPANSSPLFAYLASPAAQNITAQLFIVWGRQVVVMARPAHGAVFDNDAAWSVEALHRHLAPHFEKQKPIVDGYPMPEM